MFGNKGTGRTYDVFKIRPEEKNGKIHVILYNVFDKVFGPSAGVVKDYTKVELLISCIQDDGYEVVDIKYTSNAGTDGITNGYSVLVMYK